MSWSEPVSSVAPQRSTCFDHASCCPGECPSARAMSRTAFLGRYWMTLATWAARSRPVGLVDPLDDLFAPVGVEVDVDVGLVAKARQEPLERSR
ncbi:hypothetical protein HR12_43430 [Microbacterium sp. SUBG005]|nr:hypothetical protein HR12_43430 [Microbacterium sp. SUBG005]